MAQELITMTPKELSRYEVIKKLLSKEINGTEAAKQLALSVRQIKRLKANVKKQGSKGIIHAGRGKPGNRKMSKIQVEKMETIIRARYVDFGPTFAAEKLEQQQIKVSSEKLRQLMISWDLWKAKPRKKNGEYRAWRQRKEQYGEMIQFDGSYHHWFEDRADKCCLLAAIDDATSRIIKLKFVQDEGTLPVFSFWKPYTEKHGKPLTIYLDRLRTYKQNLKSVFDDPNCRTQFQRVIETDLGIKIIHAYSCQAKGRAERLFKTLQDRLIKEMRLAGISSIEQANQFTEQVYIPKHNAKFVVLAQKKGDLHKSLTKFEKGNLDKIFSVYETRTVNNDFTVRHKGKWYQLAQQQPCLVRKREKVQMEQRISDELLISLRDRYLNYTVLPGRPEKVIEVKIPALATARPVWKPPADHPWRRSFSISKKNIRQPVLIN